MGKLRTWTVCPDPESPEHELGSNMASCHYCAMTQRPPTPETARERLTAIVKEINANSGLALIHITDIQRVIAIIADVELAATEVMTLYDNGKLDAENLDAPI